MSSEMSFISGGNSSWNTLYVVPQFIYIYVCTPFVDLSRLFSCLILYSVGWAPWTGDQPVSMPLPAHITTRTQNKRRNRYPCHEWDSNPWSQSQSERRLFTTQTERPLIGRLHRENSTASLRHGHEGMISWFCMKKLRFALAATEKFIVLWAVTVYCCRRNERTCCPNITIHK
jgi:hypothetical protein